MITEEEYKNAISQKEKCEKIITSYYKQKDEDFAKRWEAFLKDEQYFTDDELTYSAYSKCHCGSGLAYPKSCDIHHQWSCADVLTGRTKTGKHESYPFAFYEIKSENQPSANGSTTRPKQGDNPC